MRRSTARLLCASLATSTIAAFGGACLEPTQVTLRVTSNVPCELSKGTAFSGGKLGVVERAKPSTVTMDCRDGEIGTLVATPSGDKDSNVAFVVVQGVDRPAEECAANGYKGCIVQRRSVSYQPHTPLTIPIAMRLICKDVACDEFTTCARSGKCVPAALNAVEKCETGDCWPEGDGPDNTDVDPDSGGATDAATTSDGPRIDGAVTTDGSTADGSTADGPTADGSTSGDGAAGGDATTDAPAPGPLFCPPVQGGCAAANACCWSRTGSQGRCAPENECVADELPMRCNGKSDCPASEHCCGYFLLMEPPGPPEYEMIRTECAAFPSGKCHWVCRTDGDCPDVGMTCDKTAGYFTPSGVFGTCLATVVER